MSLLIARAAVTPMSTNPATSPMMLPQKNLMINDLVILTTSDSRLLVSVSKTGEAIVLSCPAESLQC
jgi:hypothetical protein